MRKKHRKEVLRRLDNIEANCSSIIALLEYKVAAIQAEEERKQNEWLQEGIDSIMGYQWPPKKGGNE